MIFPAISKSKFALILTAFFLLIKPNEADALPVGSMFKLVSRVFTKNIDTVASGIDYVGIGTTAARNADLLDFSIRTTAEQFQFPTTRDRIRARARERLGNGNIPTLSSSTSFQDGIYSAFLDYQPIKPVRTYVTEADFEEKPIQGLLDRLRSSSAVRENESIESYARENGISLNMRGNETPAAASTRISTEIEEILLAKINNNISSWKPTLPPSSNVSKANNLSVTPQENLTHKFLYHPDSTFTKRLNTIYDAEVKIVDEPVLIAAIPTNERSFVAVYSKPYTQNSERQLSRLRSEIDGLENADLFGGGVEDFLANLETKRTNTITLLIHSENKGNLLVFPNGQSITANELHLAAAFRNKRLILLTCNGKEIGINGRLYQSEAISLWKDSITLLKASDSEIVEDFVDIVRSTRNQTQVRKIISYSVVVTGAGGTIYMAQYQD